ncbi:[FeFe] hydrogenase (group B1/B3) [Hydrogenoanaerobacterium saccharovorans]|uniref:[FeFe] hydrogenase, group B1/B3 n=1 Tax=Hydrogenoanaerobacterium saccharovorans TaxID=474960 RepID=A0A1H8BEM7_9FIRM|nr:4Fe-4S dicluster domain-containing protein [Hydrogenoanaerobacterium saccharovorans]RPF47453.1 [FeFe] hydrogenase (group B1/B3) [Hydrogenoanaerobacterium saccharovorans]SEM81206.1 [FeFe] hydrogenase, group B1/B3 [Hydrogenoanaerobacterium saccharovorans]
MRGIYTPVTKIRRQVFAEVARMAYEGGDYSRIVEIPFKIIPGEVPTYRDSVFVERAIVGERLRLAIGLPLYPADNPAPISRGVEESAIAKKVYDPPLINVIPFACNKCEETSYLVTNNCRGCLAHPCISVCPVKAISMVNGRSVIDKTKCVKCGRCKETCPYEAIVRYDRPCSAACGVDAIESDHLGRAKINYEKCVSCGMCLVSCPFGAIADKSQIFQLIHAIKEGDEVIGAIAPAFVGQFGPLATPDKVKEAIKRLGFADVVEVAIGADIGAVEEAKHYVHKVVSGEEPFLATSCCPSWSVMAKNKFPEIAPYVSDALTPMVATARIIKKDRPNAKIVFIGPCAAKKLEASRRTVRSDVDFVITFEELMGMFVAKGIEFGEMEKVEKFDDATAAGRGYSVAGGVADAIAACVKEMYPDVEMQVDRAEGLKNCAKMLMLAKAGKRDGYLMEGMACPGGCVGGAGTLMPLNKAMAAVKSFQNEAAEKIATKNPLLEQENK